MHARTQTQTDTQVRHTRHRQTHLFLMLFIVALVQQHLITQQTSRNGTVIFYEGQIFVPHETLQLN